MIRRFRKISTKLFVLTSLFLTVFLTLLMIVQSSFFESYYERKKINELRSALESFKSSYYKEQDEVNKLTEQFPEFEKRYSATMALGQVKDGLILLGAQPRTTFIQTVDQTGNVLRIQTQQSAIGLSPDNGLKTIISAMNRWRENSGLVRQVLDLGDTVTFTSKIAEGGAGASSIAVVTPLKNAMTTDHVLLAVSSLQPVGEAANIVRDFYVYFLLLAIALIVLLTYVFSRMISRPLVKLNVAAGRMANLDFSAKCDVETRDEIGSLGGTLNFLSQNLNDTLGQLHSANEKLKADIENEKRLERLRREFVASVSHELKTPISLIGGYAEGLRDDIVQGERREEYLDVIVEETERMASIVKDMLDLSQLEAGKYNLRQEPFRIGALAGSLTDKMFVELKKRVVCAVELESADAIVYGDEFRIGQVLTNLLGNAIKHTPEGGKIRISTEEGPGSGVPGANGCVRIEVYNDGDPIPEADLPYIWDTFYTVDKSGSREIGGGSGIGLAIVKNILTLHGSEFGVRNVSGGVLFYFTLPLIDEEP
ncbi:HAMP domain-containing protein [Paenibacillus mesophilus]|uniref:sensor histidine kinase n=1 Tax=Paenibacillus mesophilus TaxID=2582849 RepID=UPI00110E8C7B|nr:HAMP domain-containing sensor histidine kinase [Paenibacillus mesophilus]TMV51484.1 HAMP domain-containing protein [Paenibacillus mesophilus]